MADKKLSPVRLLSVDIQNFKVVKAARIDFPEDRTVKVTGRNGAGKSSVLDAIESAFAGDGASPREPIRRGEASARVVATTTDLVVERRWTEKGSYLSVRGADGSTIKAPQQVLDALVGPGGLAFDPYRFVSMKPSEQVDALRAALGLKDELDAFEQARQEVYDNRTNVTRELKKAEATLAANPFVAGPDAEVSVSQLVEEHRQAMDAERGRVALVDAVAKAKKAATDIGAKIASLEEELAELRADLELAGQAVEAAQQALDGVGPLPDADAIASRMRTIEADNQNARKRIAHRNATEAVAKLRKQHEEMTADIARIDQQRDELVRSKKMPIEGLTIEGTGLHLDGVPLAQAATSEQLRISVAVALAANPRLRLMLVRNGSLLDSKGMQLLETLAHEYGAQLAVEVTTDGEPGVGVLIEDGEVVE